MKNLVFDTEKSLNAILYIASKLKRKDIHKIFKILYFSDRNHLAKYGRTITGDTYIKMEAGPVPSNIYDIIKAVRGDSFFTPYGKKYAEKFTIEANCLIKPTKEANLDYLSLTDIKEIDAVIAQYGEMSFAQLKMASHDFAWSNSKDNEEISFEDLLRETGEDEEFISYLKELNDAHQYICS